MSRRLKITLPDTLAGQLDALARDTGEPAARLAGLMVRDGLANAPHEQARKGPAEPTASLRNCGRRAVRPAGAVARALRRRPRVEHVDVGSDLRAPRPLPLTPRSTQEGLVEKRDARRDSLRSSFGVKNSMTLAVTHATRSRSSTPSSTTAKPSAKKAAASPKSGPPEPHPTNGGTNTALLGLL